ncbi:MAG: hypothetical protein WC101_02660 [Candidatus Gracilibacteria bacterium]|nr:hypothetical protein [Candidatus Gracilibacteria bacterium]
MLLPERKVRFAAALCYLPFASVVAALVSLLKFPHLSFAIFHVRQGFALFLVWFLSFLLLTLSVWFGLLVWLALIVLSVRAALSAWNGREIPFPGIRSLASMMPVAAIYTHLTDRDFPRQ